MIESNPHFSDDQPHEFVCIGAALDGGRGRLQIVLDASAWCISPSRWLIQLTVGIIVMFGKSAYLLLG